MNGMTTDERPCRHVIGAMTGTSIDGLDIALVRIIGRGLTLRAELIPHDSHVLGGLGHALRRLASGEAQTAKVIARLALRFGELHADAIATLLEESRIAESVDLIAVHGQTVFHRPPISWQLINPAPIAQRVGAPVIFDLRQADLAAGGQGAPVTPLADWILFRHPQRRRAIVNLGGFCNITILPRDTCDAERAISAIEGFDLCACNQLLDAVARTALGVAYDDRGRHAAAGNAHPSAVESLRQRLISPRSEQPSLGTGDERVEWVTQQIDRLSGDDLAATAVAAIARCIGDRINDSHVDEVILAGGGANNEALVQSIAQFSTSPILLSDDCGIPAPSREAVAMAVLGALCADRVPMTLPHITGCRPPAPIAGVWMRP